jgi:NADP-dependent 3-hydroxy acid dehydrogenase YdfG
MATNDPVFLITGASSGIGAATARRAADAGYRLVLAARSKDKLQDLVRELGEERAVAVECDVTDAGDQERAVQRARDAFGRLDVAFANAGTGSPRGFTEGTPEEARETILTNVYGVYLTIRSALGALRETHGHLVLTSSIAGRRALKGSLYSATKFSVTAMGEAARLELNGTGARVTLIEPGMVETPGFSHELDETLTADDIARAVMYAVSQPAHVDVNEIMIRPTAQTS